MILLEPSQYECVRPLFASLAHYLTIDAILAGKAPGWVFVDDAVQPQTAVCWTHHRVYLAGRVDAAAQAAVYQLFQTIFLPEAEAENLEVYLLHTTPEWQETAVVALPWDPPIRRMRRTYCLDTREQEWHTAVPEGFALRQVNAALLAEPHITNLAFLTEEMVSERPSIDDFLVQSSGVCLLHENEIIGWCLSEYNCGNRCEIGIAVTESYRRRGLASLMARALIGDMLVQEVHDVGWICWADNAPSVKTAESLGFTLVDERPIFMGFLAEWLHTAVHGNIAWENGRFAAAADSYEHALTLNTQPPVWLHWNAACVFARTGQPEEAVQQVQLAIDAGFNDWERLAASPHFNEIRETKAWRSLQQENLHG